MSITRQQRRLLAKHNAKRPASLSEVPRDQWPASPPAGLQRVWHSRDYLVQQYGEECGVRLSVCRTSMEGSRWVDGLTWDELQAIKQAVGYGQLWAAECYPPDEAVVNVANMRHLWILPGPPAFGWNRSET